MLGLFVDMAGPDAGPQPASEAEVAAIRLKFKRHAHRSVGATDDGAPAGNAPSLSPRLPISARRGEPSLPGDFTRKMMAAGAAPIETAGLAGKGRGGVSPRGVVRDGHARAQPPIPAVPRRSRPLAFRRRRQSWPT